MRLPLNTGLAISAPMVLVALSCGQIDDSFFRGPNLAPVGDWNEDGASDFAVGDFTRARVLVLSGRDGEIIRELKGKGDFGWGICSLGRSDSESRALVVSTPKSGRVEIFTAESKKPVRVIEFAKGRPGWAMSAIEDFDEDGDEDLLLAIPEYLESGEVVEGRAAVVSSGSGETLVRVESSEEHNRIGFAVAPIGDLDGDSRSEILVGSVLSSEFKLYSGSDGAFVREFARVGNGSPFHYVARYSTQSGLVALSDPDVGRGGVVALIQGDGQVLARLRGDYYGDRFGHSLTFIPGEKPASTPYLLIGAPGEIKAGGLPMMPLGEGEPTGDEKPGLVRLFSGETHEQLWEYSRDVPGDWFGEAVCGLSDIDGDGATDCAALAQEKSGGPGIVVILSGKTGAPILEARLPN